MGDHERAGESAAESHFDIVIVGGGMVGISLALMLCRDFPAWRIALLESHPLPQIGSRLHHQPSFDSRSTALAAGSRRLFEHYHLWEFLAPHLTPIRRVHVSDRGHFGGMVMAAADYAMEALGYVAENAWLGKVLAAALGQSPVRCFAPCEVQELRAVEGGYELRLADSSCLHTRLAVLADGADSKLRQQLGIGSSREDYYQHGIVANVLSDQAHGGVAFERFTDSGPVALLPMGEGPEARQSALIWTLPDEQAEGYRFMDEGEFLQHLQQRFGYRQGRFVSVSKRHSYPLSLIRANEQIRRGLVLMGNAAHALHPVAGQGFNLALRDCAALSRVLKEAARKGENIGDLGVLERYLAAQKDDQAMTIQLSHQFVRLFSSRQLTHSALRALGLFGLDMLPPAKDLFARQTMGMG